MQKNKENFKRKNISKKKFNSNYKYFKQKNRNYFYKKKLLKINFDLFN